MDKFDFDFDDDMLVLPDDEEDELDLPQIRFPDETTDILPDFRSDYEPDPEPDFRSDYEPDPEPEPEVRKKSERRRRSSRKAKPIVPEEPIRFEDEVLSDGFGGFGDEASSDGSDDYEEAEPAAAPPRKERKPRKPLFTPEEKPYLPLRFGLLALLILAFAWTAYGYRSRTNTEVEPETQVLVEEMVQESAEPVVEPDVTVTLAFTGDIMGHKPLSTSNYDEATGTYDYSPIFAKAGDSMTSADYLVGNLETTFSNEVSGYPLFSSPDDLASYLKDYGFDMVTTANNHCMDHGFDGLCRTLDTLDSVGLDHVGTYRSQEEYDACGGVLLEDINGVSVAFLDYTYGTNYISVSEDYSVNRYNLSTENEFVTDLNTDLIDEQLAYAEELEPDAIIVCIHWGIEYQTVENSDQEMVADYLIAHGADAVIGGHAHVPQPLEYRTVTLDDGSERTGFVCYSLGNLISNQTDAYTYITAALQLELTREGDTGETSITNVSYTPLYLLNRGSGSNPRYQLLDTREAIEDYEAGNSDLTEYEFTLVQNSLSDLESIFGTEVGMTER